jgi:hypothetical protein
MDLFVAIAMSRNPQRNAAYVQRIGAGRTIYLIPANEPRTIEIEKQFLQSFPSVPGDGYFKIDTTYRKPE